MKSPIVVGIGASAGGLEAFTALLKHLPLDTALGFVLVQHLDPQHESALTQLLARATSMPVREATNNVRVKANCVYVIPPNTKLTIGQGLLKLAPRQQTRTPIRSIDTFFESLAQDQRERAIGVILSGTATDGTLGLEAIKAEGGITFAQDESARYDSMPRNAVAAGCVDFVLKPEDIAKELARIAKHPLVTGQPIEPPGSAAADRAFATAHEDDETALPSGGHGPPRSGAVQAHADADTRRGRAADNGYKKILLLLRNHCGVDFSLYKSTTIQRRITRRMVLNKLETLDNYFQFLKGNAKELDALYSDALISVTSFFRNPEAFDVLKHKIFPKLVERRGDQPIRVWVLGCSTGQEAYSIAMAFVEAADNAPLRKLQVFATDLNDALLDKARHGLYAKSLAQDISPERLRRFFVEEEGGLRISKSLREMVVFARQNLMSDPPFSRMDLVSCRNLLIYLEPSLQAKLLPTFHYALRPEGFLFLGASESVGAFTDLFEPVDKKHKIYCKKASLTRSLHLPVKKDRGEHPSAAQFGQLGPPRTIENRQDEPPGFGAELNSQREADRITVNKYAPPGVLVNADLQILQFRGPSSAYLKLPTGKASFDVLKMAREGLMLPLRAAINEAKKRSQTVRKEKVRIKQNGEIRMVSVEVVPLKNLRERCFLILFEEAEKATRAVTETPDRGQPNRVGRTPRPASKKEESGRIAGLERELAETRDYLQSIQEQYEAANEELQASNEEVQSTNEELQSINEELQTSKEELESANEELTTVNEEMANRNIELGRLNSDLVNLQTSTNLAIVLVGRDLTIRRFSARAEKPFNLMAADVGHSLGALRHNLDVADLKGLVEEVISSVHEREHELRDREGRWYSLRVRPYLAVDNKVDGAVLVLVDIDALKRAELQITEARKHAETIIDTVPDPILVLYPDLRVHSANDAFYRTFKLSPAEIEQRPFLELDHGSWGDPSLRQLLKDVIPRNSFFNDFEITREFERIGRRTLLVNGRPLRGFDEKSPFVLLGIRDITDVLTFQAELRRSEQKFRLLFKHSPLPKWTFNVETLQFVDVNDAAVQHYGYSREEFLQMRILDVRTPEAAAAFKATIARPPHCPPEKETCQHRKKSGEVIDVEVVYSEFTLVGKQVWLASIIDITDRKLAEERQQFLMNELVHRGKNLLAVVQSIVFRSMSGKLSLAEEREALSQRLQALGRSQSVLVTENLVGAPVAELLRLEFEGFSGRLAAVGPQVMLNQKAAQTFTLLVHELATNATKHGALSRPEGQIAIHWSIEGEGTSARFKFRWQERGGPPVVPPTHEGFGRILLEKAVGQDFDTQPKVRFAREGLIYEIDAPLLVVTARAGETAVFDQRLGTTEPD